MTFKKGESRPKNAGRKKGSLNKETKALREMILCALHKAGGEEYLAAQAITSPSAFLALIGKVLPTTIAGDAENPLTHNISVSIKPVSKK